MANGRDADESGVHERPKKPLSPRAKKLRTAWYVLIFGVMIYAIVRGRSEINDPYPPPLDGGAADGPSHE